METFKMMKMEAAEIMALDVRVFARKHDQKIDKSLVEERISEYRGLAGEGTRKGVAATVANVTTTLRIALEQERNS